MACHRCFSPAVRLALCIFTALFLLVVGQFEYYTTDNFDRMTTKLRTVNGDNCHIKNRPDLFLQKEAVSHLPDIKEVNINPQFPNRSALLHVHNMAHARAFFWSYILQSRFKRPSKVNDTDQSEYDPGFMYYFLSSVADVAANPKLNASGTYFQPNMSYTSSYKGFYNKTMPLFGPRAFRMDDYNDPVHLERVSTLNFIQVDDLGAIPLHGMSSLNYSSDDYRINEWWSETWMPHRHENHDGLTTFQVQIRYANNTNETYTFHGPNAADENPGPVQFSRPYFDCGRSNKWSVPASSPFADLYPRHTQFRHIEYPTWTGITVMEMDFDRIDINQCPPGPGNDGDNIFADTARCKKETTMCEPLDGYGFRRGGYQCPCKPGNRLPNVVRRPYLGEFIERATWFQYKQQFNCVPIGFIHKLPLDYGRMGDYERSKYLSYYNNASGINATKPSSINVFNIVDFLKNVTDKNCHTFPPDHLILRGDISYGKEKQFEYEARMGLRLANFISSFLQIVDHTEIFSGLREVDRPLTEDQMMGEILSIILGDNRIWSAGLYWDRSKFPDRTLFAPIAWKTQLNTRKYKMEDLARLNKTNEVYTNKAWFRKLKNRWSTNFDDLEKYWIKLKLRHNSTGGYAIKYERFPTFYKAAELHHGQWSEPEFDCSGPVKKWLVKYTAPFFGWDTLRKKLEFKGAVQISVDLLKLDINQCPEDYHVQNAFKDSHHCDRQSSYCVPIQGRWFESGGYKCECIQGFEYPYEDHITYFDGQIMEAEYLNIVKDKASRFDFLKCRIAGAASLQVSVAVIMLMIFLRVLVRHQ